MECGRDRRCACRLSIAVFPAAVHASRGNGREGRTVGLCTVAVHQVYAYHAFILERCKESALVTLRRKNFNPEIFFMVL